MGDPLGNARAGARDWGRAVATLPAVTPMLAEWAAAWGIPAAAVTDLQARLGVVVGPSPTAAPVHTEAWVQNQVRLEAASLGMHLWRNNVGALLDSRGVPVRYGLANDSASVNTVIKSADLIGIKPVKIAPTHVGCVLGQFVSRECKAPGWQFSGSSREIAQIAWATLVTTLGGDAGFATGRGSLLTGP